MAVGYKDYYQTLGVARDAGREDIQRVYRKLARKYHPDLNKGPDAEQKFKEINEAYQVLKDPEKRKAYDQLGAGWQEGQDFRPPPDWQADFDSGSRSGFGSRSDFRGAGEGDFSDFFETLFGGAFRQQYQGPGGRGTFVRAGADHEAVLRISLEEAFRGGMKTVTLTSQAPQPNGSVTSGQKTYDVKIPAGIRPDQKIRLGARCRRRGSYDTFKKTICEWKLYWGDRMTVKYSMVLKQAGVNRTSSVRVTEIADLCNTHPHIIDRFVCLGLVDPAGRDENNEEWIFQREVIPLVRKIIRLRNELGINYAGIGVVLDLLSRIEQLEAQIQVMQDRSS